MNMTFPRLTMVEAERVLLGRHALTLGELEALEIPPLETARFPPTGPGRVSRLFLERMRAELLGIAKEAGYPERSDRSARQFDSQAAEYLGQLGLPPGEMLRPDTWTWLAVHLLPSLVEWRWGGEARAHPSRYGGRGLQRNAIGRLWYRSFVLDAPEGGGSRWELLRLVNEDAHSGILERTSISRDRRLSRQIVASWNRYGRSESLLRDALIRVRIQAILIEMNVLTDLELFELVDWAFRRVHFRTEADPLLVEPVEIR